MNEKIEENLLNKTLDNESIIFRANANLRGTPDGSLHILYSHEKYKQYYWYKQKEKEEFPNGRYIRRKDMELVKQLAQKDYDKEIIKNCRKQNSLIRAFLKKLQELEAEEVYEKLAPARKTLIAPWHETEQQRTERWYEEHPSYGNTFPFEEEYVNSKGMKLRSKSEIIISEVLLRLNIPFVYEPEMIIHGTRKYPDFAIYNVKENKTVYLEHFGMMDNPEYAEKNVRKMNEYLTAGLKLGQDIIFTFETNTCHLNAKTIETILSNCL